MPTVIDLSSWNSLWTLERMKQTNYKPRLKETLFEFRLAYLITGILAVMFVTLGSHLFSFWGRITKQQFSFCTQYSNIIH
ncbi:MAG: hypothetical protein ACRBB5_00165 [Nitrosopumilus sp.]